MAQKFVTNLDLNKNELQNARIQNLASAPSAPVAGQVYYNTVDNVLYVYNGTAWLSVVGDIQEVIAGTGLDGGGSSGSVTIDLANTAVVAGSYGSGTAIPTFTVDAQGRLTAASEVNVATSLGIAGDSGTDTVSLLSDTLTFSGGTGVTTVVTNNDVEIYIGQDVAASASPSFAALTTTGNLIVGGDLTVNGLTTTINSTVITIDDPIFTLGGDGTPSSDDNKDRGIEFKWHDGSSAKVGFFGFDDSTGRFTFIPDATNSSEVFSGTLGNFDANAYFLNGTEVLSGTTLGSTIVTSSLTSVGTIATGTWEATDVAVAHGGTGSSTESGARQNLAGDITVGAGQVSPTTVTLAKVFAVGCAASSGATSTTTVTHNFNSSDVSVQVYEVATNATVVADVVRTSSNVVTVTMNGASISAGDYRIVVTG